MNVVAEAKLGIILRSDRPMQLKNEKKCTKHAKNVSSPRTEKNKMLLAQNLTLLVQHSKAEANNRGIRCKNVALLQLNYRCAFAVMRWQS